MAATHVLPAGLELVYNESRLLLRPSPHARDRDAPATEDGGPYVCWENASADATTWCASSHADGEGIGPIRIDLSPLVDWGFYTELPACAQPHARTLSPAARVRYEREPSPIPPLGSRLPAGHRYLSAPAASVQANPALEQPPPRLAGRCTRLPPSSSRS